MKQINIDAGFRARSFGSKGLAWRLTRFVTIGLFAAFYCVAANADLQRPFYMGFTPWLYDLNSEAIESTYSYVNEHADVISHHLAEGVPWTEALAKKKYHPNVMWDWSQRRTKSASALKVFVSISPFNMGHTGLADYWGELTHMGLPVTFAGKRFNDPVVKQAYLNYAESVIEYFEPDYLAITIEANELFFNNPEKWADFVELYIETYSALKLSHPELPVFFTSSLHTMNQMRVGTDDAWSELSMLWNYSDIAAVSYYPHMQYPLDLSHPTKILSTLRDHTDKPVAISESGYPAEQIDFPGLGHIPATETLQAEMMFRMLLHAFVDEYVFFVVWAHRDYDQLMVTVNMPAISNLWRDTGVLNEAGVERTSSYLWDLVYNIPMK